MAIRVLVVDDSSFMRSRLTEIFRGDPAMEVVGSARDGQEAVRLAIELGPDVITMDVEMPVMDGIEAVRRIMRERPTPILMFSVSTQAGAKATLDALDAGAMDFMPKQLHEISGDKETAQLLLRKRVRDLAQQGARLRGSRLALPAIHPPRRNDARTAPRPEAGALRGINLLAIAASTGGPVALQKILTKLPAKLPIPVVMVQHMPGNFTGSFAERLNQVCALEVKEARDGDELRPGTALLAPGGVQMELAERSPRRIAIREPLPGEYFRPSADVTFGSIARHFTGRTLALVLTGMGSDGKIGAAALKAKGGAVWAQSEASCVVYGMPRAIVEGGLADAVFDLDAMGEELLRCRPWTP